MLKAVSVASISSSTERHKDTAGAISTSPMAGNGACSVIGPSILLGTGRQRTGPGDDSVRTDDSHTWGVKRAIIGAVNRQYSLRSRVQEWSPGVAQPLTVSLTAGARQGAGQYRVSTNRKIYLSRVTAYLDVSDTTGHLDSPDPLVDKADITPGFLVTSPSSYTQVFVLPSLPDEATRLIIEFRYEMLVLQSASTPRDFSKQTVTDTLVISRP
jgi:hypothetical protein